MKCSDVREALSAQLDGEPAVQSDESVQAHVATCAECSSWVATAADASRRVRLRAAADVDDLAPKVATALRERAMGGRPEHAVARTLLAITALVQLALSVTVFLATSDASHSAHTHREVGATEIALAFGVLAAAWQPWRAAGMLPVVAALAVGLGVITFIDVGGGLVPAFHEVPHLLAAVEAVLLFQMRKLPRRDRAERTRSRELRRVA